MILSLLACGADTAATPDADPAQSTNASILEKADARDGTEDKVVSKCPGCALGMDGSADHAVTVDGYELHFCSDSCKTTFDSDQKKGMERLGKAVN